VLCERPTDAPVTKCKVVFSYKIDPKTGTLPDDGRKVELNYAGFVFFFANAAIDWQSKLLKVMLSSAEAEVGAGA